jgi:hypothetical protein
MPIRKLRRKISVVNSAPWDANTKAKNNHQLCVYGLLALVIVTFGKMLRHKRLGLNNCDVYFLDLIFAQVFDFIQN